jgi:hypothetical protein
VSARTGRPEPVPQGALVRRGRGRSGRPVSGSPRRSGPTAPPASAPLFGSSSGWPPDQPSRPHRPRPAAHPDHPGRRAGVLRHRGGHPARACPASGWGTVAAAVRVHDRHDLTDQEWALLEPLLPDRAPRRARPWRDHRQVVDGVLWRTRTGSPWRDLPASYGKWTTVYNRHRRWSAGRDVGPGVAWVAVGLRRGRGLVGRRDRLHGGAGAPQRRRCPS